eukprot:scaffold142930_cov55-Attheya_sp.AAC.3
MEPKGGEVEGVPRLEHNFVDSCLFKERMFSVGGGFTPVHGRMTSAGMAMGMQTKVWAFLWMTQNIPSFTSQ